MRTVFIYLILALFLINPMTSQSWDDGKKVKGNGKITSSSRKTPTYDAIRIEGGLTATLVRGNEGDVIIQSESNLAEYIITEVDSDVLRVYVKKGYNLSQSSGKKITIIIPFTEITKVSLSGSGTVSSDDSISATTFTAVVSGSGDMKLLVDAGIVKSVLSGSGTLKLKGTTDKISCTLTGSGEIEAMDLNADEVDAVVTGSGDVGITVSNSIKARITGSGDIKYRGNPQNIDKKVTGSGVITKV